MRKLVAVSLILAAIVFSLLVLTGPGTAQASPAVPSHLQATTPTPTPGSTQAKLPPSGVLPDKLPPSGADRAGNTDNLALFLIGSGAVLLVAGLAIRSRRRSSV